MFKFTVKTYSYDPYGYYLGRDNWNTAIVYASDNDEAKQKAIELCGKNPSGTHDRWGAIVESSEEVMDMFTKAQVDEAVRLGASVAAAEINKECGLDLTTNGQYYIDRAGKNPKWLTTQSKPNTEQISCPCTTCSGHCGCGIPGHHESKDSKER